MSRHQDDGGSTARRFQTFEQLDSADTRQVNINKGYFRVEARGIFWKLPCRHISMIDGSGQILIRNNRLELVEPELPGALAGASLGKNLLELWRADGEATSHVAQSLENVVRGQTTSLVMEYRYETAQATRWMEVRAEELFGSQTGAVVSHIDITERKKTEGENAQNRQPPGT